MTDSENIITDPAASQTKTILLVDDQDELRITTKWFLGSFGYVVESVRSAEEALALFDPGIHDLVITDNSLGGMSGTELAHVIKLRSPSTPVLMHTGQPPEDQSCLDSVIQRPVNLLTLKEAAESPLPVRHESLMESKLQTGP